MVKIKNQGNVLHYSKAVNLAQMQLSNNQISMHHHNIIILKDQKNLVELVWSKKEKQKEKKKRKKEKQKKHIPYQHQLKGHVTDEMDPTIHDLTPEY